MNLGHWQFLTGFFRLAFVKLFISWFAIVPIAVAILKSVPEVVYVDSRLHPIALHMELPFSWVILWIASLLFSLAAVLYHLFCPAFIKRHESFAEYKKIGHSPRWIVWEIFYHLNKWGLRKRYANSEKLRSILISKKLATSAAKAACEISPNDNACVHKGPEMTTLYFKQGRDLYAVSSLQSPDPTDQKENDLFWELFGFLAGSYPPVRSAIKWLVIASFLMVAFVVLQNIWSAFTYIFS
jgi:hypothetical protein